MGRVITNGTALSYVKEVTLGVLPVTPTWYELEPNGINSFGNTYSRAARSPISRARSRRKGSVTDQDSAVEFEADLTLAHLRHFAEGFLFSRAVGGDVFEPTAAAAGSYTVPALSVAAAGRIQVSAAGATLVAARGFANAANNGLKALTVDPVAAATALTAAGVIVEAVAANDMVHVEIAGYRTAVGTLAIDAQGNLTSTGGVDFTTLGLTVGQQVHIGGIDLARQFANPVNTGFARLAIIEAGKLTLNKKDAAFVAEAGAGLTIDLLFGQFVRNVPVDHVDFKEQSYQMELASPNLLTGGLTGYEYAVGFYPDALSLALPLSGQATLTAGFVGQNTTDPSGVRALNANNAKIGGQTGSFSTSNDIARLRVAKIDETGLSTDFKSASLTISNNVSGEKVLGRLGAKYLNAGNFEVDVENQMLFTNAEVLHVIRCNEDVGFDFVLRNGDGGAAFDFPVGTLDGGGREYPINESVLINTTFAAHQNDNFGFSLGISFFPVLPPQPC